MSKAYSPRQASRTQNNHMGSWVTLQNGESDFQPISNAQLREKPAGTAVRPTAWGLLPLKLTRHLKSQGNSIHHHKGPPAEAQGESVRWWPRIRPGSSELPTQKTGGTEAIRSSAHRSLAKMVIPDLPKRCTDGLCGQLPDSWDRLFGLTRVRSLQRQEEASASH